LLRRKICSEIKGFVQTRGDDSDEPSLMLSEFDDDGYRQYWECDGTILRQLVPDKGFWSKRVGELLKASYKDFVEPEFCRFNENFSDSNRLQEICRNGIGFFRRRESSDFDEAWHFNLGGVVNHFDEILETLLQWVGLGFFPTKSAPSLSLLQLVVDAYVKMQIVQWRWDFKRVELNTFRGVISSCTCLLAFLNPLVHLQKIKKWLPEFATQTTATILNESDLAEKLQKKVSALFWHFAGPEHGDTFYRPTLPLMQEEFTPLRKFLVSEGGSATRSKTQNSNTGRTSASNSATKVSGNAVWLCRLVKQEKKDALVRMLDWLDEECKRHEAHDFAEPFVLSDPSFD
jgi:hypothetical protein